MAFRKTAMETTQIQRPRSMAYVRDECPVSVFELDPKVARNRSLDNPVFPISREMMLIDFVNG